MILSTEQLRALTELRQRANELQAAEWAFAEAEGLCCSLGISYRQIGFMGRTPASTVMRRQRKRVQDIMEEIST